MKQDVTQQVEKVLSSLDQVNRASVSPYFYSRLRTRMEAGNAQPQHGFSLQPAFTILALLFLLVLNIYLLLNQSVPKEQKWTEVDDQTQWTTEYALQESTPYQENPIEWVAIK
jgi:hypothetical protein